MSTDNIELDDLLLSDHDDDGKEVEKNKNESPKPKLNMFSKPELIKTNPVNIDKDIEKSLKPDKKEIEINDKINLPIMSSSSINEEPVKKDNPPPNSDFLAFVFGTNANANTNTNTNANPINVPKTIQDKISNSSSISNKFKDIKSGSGKGMNKISVASSSIVQPPPITQKVEPIVFVDARKKFEEHIQNLSRQKEEIKSELPRAINEKSYEYTRIEKLNKNEIEKLEDKYESKLNRQQNTFKEKEDKYNKQKDKIEDERIYKINNIREMQNKSYQQQLDQLENNFKHRKDSLEAKNNIEIQKIDLELQMIKEEKKRLFEDQVSTRKITDLYNDLYKKINSSNHDIELNIKLKEKQFLQKDLKSKCDELSEEEKRTEENVKMYEDKILEVKMELEEISNKIRTEKNDLKNKEHSLNNEEIEIKRKYMEKKADLEKEEKDLEEKIEEEKRKYDNQEIIYEENLLKEEKKHFEEEKKKVMKELEDKNKEIRDKTEEIKKKEFEIEKQLMDIRKEELKINNNLNGVQNLNSNNLLERNNIDKERYNLELIGKRIEMDINLLERDKESIMKDKEKNKENRSRLENEIMHLDNELKLAERERLNQDIKSQQIDKKRLQMIKDNKLNDFDQIGLRTSPQLWNLGNNLDINNNNNNYYNTFNDKFNSVYSQKKIDDGIYGLNGNGYNGYIGFNGQNEYGGFKSNIYNDQEINPKNIYSQTSQKFKKSNGRKKFNADEYFEKLKMTLKENRKSDNDDIGNINVYLNKEYNFIKEMKEGLNEYK